MRPAPETGDDEDEASTANGIADLRFPPLDRQVKTLGSRQRERLARPTDGDDVTQTPKKANNPFLRSRLTLYAVTKPKITADERPESPGSLLVGLEQSLIQVEGT